MLTQLQTLVGSARPLQLVAGSFCRSAAQVRLAEACGQPHTDFLHSPVQMKLFTKQSVEARLFAWRKWLGRALRAHDAVQVARAHDAHGLASFTQTDGLEIVARIAAGTWRVQDDATQYGYELREIGELRYTGQGFMPLTSIVCGLLNLLAGIFWVLRHRLGVRHVYEALQKLLTGWQGSSHGPDGIPMRLCTDYDPLYVLFEGPTAIGHCVRMGRGAQDAAGRFYMRFKL